MASLRSSAICRSSMCACVSNVLRSFSTADMAFCPLLFARRKPIVRPAIVAATAAIMVYMTIVWFFLVVLFLWIENLNRLMQSQIYEVFSIQPNNRDTIFLCRGRAGFCRTFTSSACHGVVCEAFLSALSLSFRPVCISHPFLVCLCAAPWCCTSDFPFSCRHQVLICLWGWLLC